MGRPPPQSYLLRLWREHPDAPVRVTIIAVSQPEAQRHFADLDAVYAYLRAQVAQETDQNEAWDTTYCTPSKTD